MNKRDKVLTSREGQIPVRESVPARKRVFISYSQSDGGEFAKELADWLKGNGIETWLDSEIGYGENYDVQIEQAIQECDVFLVVVTGGSIRPKSFVRQEIQHASDLKKLIIPVRLTGEDAQWPILLKRLQWLSPDDALGKKLLDCISQTVRPTTKGQFDTANQVESRASKIRSIFELVIGRKQKQFIVTAVLCVFCSALLIYAGGLFNGPQVPVGPIDEEYFPRLAELLEIPPLDETKLRSDIESVIIEFENTLSNDVELLVFDCSRYLLDPTNVITAWSSMPFKSSESLSEEAMVHFQHFLGERTTGDAILIIRDLTKSLNGLPVIILQKRINLIEKNGKRILLMKDRSAVQMKVVDDD